MKGLFTVLFAILTFQLYAQESQNYSIINFVNSLSGGKSYLIYLNGQQAATIGSNENIEYKIYSEGRVSITVLADQQRLSSYIDVKRGNTYYYALKYFNFGPVDESKGRKMYEKNANTIKMEEDKDNPLNKLTKNNDENTGPKQGTCFLLNQQGYLLTNYHVISDAKTVQIKGIGNDFSTLYGVDVVAYDIDLDLALLKLKNQNLTFPKIPYGLSLETNPQGTKSFVLGFPMTTAMGEEIKVTEGIISAKSGYKGTISQYQFSAAIQPGNSGSPLFNDKGEIVGVIDAKLKGAEGAGYAIKSQYVQAFLKLVDNLQIENNKAQLAEMSLTDKISSLKNFIFIVKSE